LLSERVEIFSAGILLIRRLARVVSAIGAIAALPVGRPV
jgi:hypothetical protein